MMVRMMMRKKKKRKMMSLKNLKVLSSLFVPFFCLSSLQVKLAGQEARPSPDQEMTPVVFYTIALSLKCFQVQALRI